MTNDNLKQRFKNLLSSEHINDKAKLFVKSLQFNHEKWNGLTHKQEAALTAVEARLEPKAIKDNTKFKAQYDAEKRKIALICSQYYKRKRSTHGTYYFETVSEKILNDVDFVPSKKQYEALIRSPYAKRAVIAATEPHKFKVGDLMTLRKNTPHTQVHYLSRRAYGDDIILLSIDDCNGLEYKQYQAFQVKNPKLQFYIQERFLKKIPKSRL